MGISKSVIIEQLKRSVPEFTPNAEDIEDELSYPIINDLGRFICRSADGDSWNEVKPAVAFLENLLAMEDPEAQQLVGDCLWGLIECPSIEKIRPFFGPLLAKKAQEYPPR